jgi:hypothetical protein
MTKEVCVKVLFQFRIGIIQNGRAITIKGYIKKKEINVKTTMPSLRWL